MSYSFSIIALSLAGAMASVAKELDKVVEQQPIHAADRAHAEAAAHASIGLLNEPAENEEIVVSVSGSVCRWAADAEKFSSVGLSVTAGLRQKLQPQE